MTPQRPSGSGLLRLDEAGITLVQSALAATPFGLLADIDGTLSDIAPTPDAATLLPGVADLLGQARETFAVVAVVSGRAVADLQRMVAVPGITYIGNHGMERLDPDADPGALVYPEGGTQYEGAVREALDAVYTQLAPRWPGLRAEPKGVTASLHVRNTRDPQAAEAEVARLAGEVAAATGLRVTLGKQVIEIRPPLAVHKGTAVEALVRARGLRGALYLGDDRTDIDAFDSMRRLRAAGACQSVAVAVLHADTPPGLREAADLALDTIAQVPLLLHYLLAHAD